MINFIATRPVTPIPMCCIRFFVVKKIYHPNSDSKYVLAKIHFNIRALLAGFFFYRLSRAIYSFFILPTYQIERISLLQLICANTERKME